MDSEQHTDTEKQPKYSLAPFFKTSPYLLCIAGFDGYFKKINPALTKLLGYSKEELFSKPINSFILPEDRDLTEKHRDNIRQGKPLLNFENRYITKYGKTVWLSWNSIPVNDDQLVYAIAKNITHKKKNEEKRNQLLAELTESNQRLKQLNYTTAHDLRTPVNNLLSVFNLMDISNIEDPEILEYLELLKAATGNLKRTLNSYVDDLQNEGALQDKATEIDLLEVLNSVRRSLQSLIEDANAKLQITLNGFRRITFYRTYMESIFLNLITNSIKYAHPDRAPVININTEITEGRKQLIFSDNGQGFNSEKQQDKVFGFNQTFHDHEDSKGIGLYLVYNHIKSMGGTISVESKMDEGTRFTIEFRDIDH